MIQQSKLEVVDISKIEFIHGLVGKQSNHRKVKCVEKEGEKTCCKCMRSQLLDRFNNNKSTFDNKCVWCKECVTKYTKNKYAKVTGRTVEEVEVNKSSRGAIVDCKKRCSICEKWKLIKFFNINNNQKSGLCPACKSCTSEYMRGYRYKETRRVKLICMMGYGGCCQCCGDSRIEMLTIEHILNKGHDLIYDATTTLMRKLIELNFPDGYTCLCVGCNQLTRHGKPCIHSEEWLTYYKKNIEPFNYNKQKELDELERKWNTMNGTGE